MVQRGSSSSQVPGFCARLEVVCGTSRSSGGSAWRKDRQVRRALPNLGHAWPAEGSGGVARGRTVSVGAWSTRFAARRLAARRDRRGGTRRVRGLAVSVACGCRVKAGRWRSVHGEG